MKFRLPLNTLLRLALIGLASTIASSLRGQALPAMALPVRQQAFANSAAGFLSGNLDDAEAKLATAIRGVAGTARWHALSGHELAHVAMLLRNGGHGPTAVAVAQRALRHFSQAIQKFSASSEPAAVANAYECMGYIEEEFFGDLDSAAKYYQAAVQLSPTTGQAAALLARVQQSASAQATRNGK